MQPKSYSRPAGRTEDGECFFTKGSGCCPPLLKEMLPLSLLSPLRAAFHHCYLSVLKCSGTKAPTQSLTFKNSVGVHSIFPPPGPPTFSLCKATNGFILPARIKQALIEEKGKKCLTLWFERHFSRKDGNKRAGRWFIWSVFRVYWAIKCGSQKEKVL